MKTRLLITLLLISTTTLLAQNLVLNPSFENTVSNCANIGGEGFRADLLNWDNANSNVAGDSCSSSDLYSACNVLPLIGGPEPTNMPYSSIGYQYSHTGTHHAGIITYGPGIASNCTPITNDNYREYIQGHTSTPLVAGQNYCVSLYVSLADNALWSSNNIGVRFSNTQYMRDACANGNNSIINLTPQLNYTCAPITDTVNWVRVQWNYTAVGGEQYFIIGNFYNNANTTKACSNVSQSLINPYAYYYIDDVSIVPNGCCSASIMQHPAVCPTDAPFNLIATPPLGTNCNPTVTGTWSGPGITNGSSGTFSPAVAGVGTHTLTYILSCGATVTTTITVNNCATLTVCQQTNGNLTVTGGTAPYQWQTSEVVTDCSNCLLGQCFPPICNGTTSTVYTTFSNTATATPPGTFPFRVIDNAGNSLVITTLTGIAPCACPFSIATTGTPATCGNANGTATVNVTGTGSYTYLWSNNATSASISGIVGGTYTVTVTSNGCSSSSSVTIAQSPAITLSSAHTNTTCGNANGTATVSPTSGNGPFTFLWDNNATGASLTNLSAGIYVVTVTGAGGCTATTADTIYPSTGITLAPTVTNANCTQANGNASVSATGGSGSYTYQWGNNLGTNSSISNVTTGSYTVTVSDGTCYATQTIYVGQNTSMTSSVTGVAANCLNANSGSIDLTVNGGTPNYTYLWNTNATLQDLNNIPAGEYTVVITDNAGCIIRDTFVVAAPNVPVASAFITPETCKDKHDGAIDLTVTEGTPPYTYLWSTNDTTQDLIAITEGVYTVTITDSLGCTTTQSDTLQPGNDFPISVILAGDTLIASVAPAYQWYYNGVAISGANSQTYVPSQSGAYFVTASVNGCKFGSNTIVITSVAELSNFTHINVFPNPANDNITVNIDLRTPQKVALNLVDMLGRKITSATNNTKASTFQFTLSVKEVSAGIYFLNISTEGESKSVKVMVRN